MTTMFISKYALADGGEILEVEADRGKASIDTWAFAKIPGAVFEQSFKVGKDIHETREAAIKAAEVARTKRVGQLEKQLTALRNKVFQ